MQSDNKDLSYSNDDQTILTDESVNNSIIGKSILNDSNVDSSYEINFNGLIDGLRSKPEHWTDEYWLTIISNYKWFLHKDGNVGCFICYRNKTFMGKKSYIASMKLKIMDLSYAEFEKKLFEHKISTQHSKSVSMYNELLLTSDNPNKISTITNEINKITNNIGAKSVLPPPIPRRIFTIDFLCPLCSKGYKMKKALAKHIYNCNNERNSNGFAPPCECKGCTLYSICAIDDHNMKVHMGKYVFNCKVCEEQHQNAKSLYGHMLLSHDYQWNPYTDMPTITEAVTNNVQQEVVGTSIDRKKMYSDSINDVSKYDYRSEYDTKRRKLVIDETIPDNKIEKIINRDKIETSRLLLSLDQIYTCEYCGGRYLSANILNEHLNTRHLMDIEEDEENSDRNLKYRQENKPLSVLESSNISSQIKKPAVTNTSSKRIPMKKKVNEEKSVNGQDNQVSACLLTCPLCQEFFASLDDRNDHVSKLHPEIQQFICHHCGLIFTNHTNYKGHLERSHNSNVLSRPNKSSCITTHSCTSCPLVFTNHADLCHHINLSHPEVTVAPIVVESSNNLETTDLLQDKLVELIPDDVDSFIVALANADSKEFQCLCSICDSVFHNPFELQVHLLSHNDNGKGSVDLPSCPNCNRLFFGEFSRMYLKDHYNIEHLKKPTPQCQLCKVSFASSYILDKHLVDGRLCKSDTIEDPYHRLTMEDKLAFSCSQCGSIFAGENSKSRLESHNAICTFELMDEDEFLDQ